ncbi:hypothetical protein [Actinomadura fibrosa]|uniref:Uncharacterized protein n=1 Tax=Actinomadura fibrosa TaxID=111802 RepID=A0ABW2XIJ7_9ACTN|nr:hypothetical protein [Actinomadura fibrosa]
MKRHVIIHVDLSWQRPGHRADPLIVREPAGSLSEPAPVASPAGAEPAGRAARHRGTAGERERPAGTEHEPSIRHQPSTEHD